MSFFRYGDDGGGGSPTTCGRDDDDDSTLLTTHLDPDEDLHQRPQSMLWTEDISPQDMTVRKLIFAVMDEDIVGARKLAKKLEVGVDAAVAAVDDPNNKNRGPLHMAARTGYVGMCKMLIKDFKCNVDSADKYGGTPLLFAVDGSKPQAVVKYLINCDADPNKPNSHGITPLHLIADRGNCEVAEYLLSQGATVDPLCQYGESPLYLAARNGHARMVELLLKNNADCNRLSHRFHTPLAASLFGSSLECLEILIEAGADVNAGSPASPLTVAADKGLADCIKCLLRNSANPNVLAANGKTPIELAASKGWTECVELLFPVTNPLPKYAGMSVDEIVQLEKAVLYEASVAKGDAAYKRRDYALALKCYTKALKLGHNDTTLYAKRSLCHLYLHDQKSALDDAVSYKNNHPGLSTSWDDPQRLVLEYAKELRAQMSAWNLGSGSNPATDQADEAPSLDPARSIREASDELLLHRPR